uniref:Ig-like domain-containing protein n=1 Tax=Oryzias sinensis TaxID=183150 RepID=A0A8C7YMF5_9TELE
MLTNSTGYTISSNQDQFTGTEGKFVTIECNYQTNSSDIILHWYKHDFDLQDPQFILWKGAKKRFDAELKDKSVPLKIQKLHVSDSAVYYCALHDRKSCVAEEMKKQFEVLLFLFNFESKNEASF